MLPPSAGDSQAELHSSSAGDAFRIPGAGRDLGYVASAQRTMESERITVPARRRNMLARWPTDIASERTLGRR